jgi:hypothetical protein
VDPCGAVCGRFIIVTDESRKCRCRVLGFRHPIGMKTKEMLKGAARWLLGREDRKTGCSVEGCGEKPTIAVAGDSASTLRMCRRHAIAWTESSLCRDYAQHNSGAGSIALSTWLNVSRATT